MPIPNELSLRVIRREDGGVLALTVSEGIERPLTGTQMMQVAAALFRGAADAPGGWEPRETGVRRKATEPDQVYLLSDGMYQKIGISNGPGKRAMEISRELGRPARLLHSFACSDARGAEIKLHAAFRKQHMHGEWFSLKADQIRAIEEIRTYSFGLFLSKGGPTIILEDIGS